MTDRHITIISFLLVVGMAFGGSRSVSAQAVGDSQMPGWQPQLALSAAFDDNILRTETNTQSDTGLLVAPSLIHRSLFSKHSLELSYFGVYAKYADHSSEDYNDHDLGADLALDLTPQVNVNLTGGYLRSHDARGVSGASLVLSAEPDRWKDSHLLAELLYGRKDSQGQLGVKVGAAARDYTNNNQQSRNRDTDTVAVTFYYNVTDKTAWLFELGQRDIKYDSAATSLDSSETEYLAGLTWEATGQTTGRIRFGYLNKDLDDASRDDFSGVTLTGEILWQPRPVDNVLVLLERGTHESNQATASYYLSTFCRLNWTHQLTELIAFQANASLQNDDYSDQREDDLQQFGLGLSYDLSERMQLEGHYDFTSRDSNTSGAIYDDNLILLTLTLSTV